MVLWISGIIQYPDAGILQNSTGQEGKGSSFPLTPGMSFKSNQTAASSCYDLAGRVNT